MKIGLLSFLFLSFAVLTSCEEMTFTEFFELGPFRVMAVVADKPEIGPSNTSTAITLTPIVSDIDAGGRNISVKVEACPDPGISFGEEPSCAGSTRKNETIPDYPSVDSNTLGPRFTGAMPPLTIQVPSGLLNGLSASEQERGVDYLITFLFQAGDETVSAYKRIHVSTAVSKNQNPILNNIRVNHLASATVIKDGDLLDVSANTPESYVAIDLSGNRTEEKEEYLVSWFTYGGTTEFTRTSVGRGTLWEDGEAQTSFDLVVAILRDDRGGSAFQVHEF